MTPVNSFDFLVLEMVLQGLQADHGRLKRCDVRRLKGGSYLGCAFFLNPQVALLIVGLFFVHEFLHSIFVLLRYALQERVDLYAERPFAVDRQDSPVGVPQEEDTVLVVVSTFRGCVAFCKECMRTDA